MRKNFKEIPKPFPDPQLYQNILEKGFIMYPKRNENYEKYLSASYSKRINYFPVKLDIENVSRCNYRYTMCPVSLLHNGTRSRDMTLKDFK